MAPVPCITISNTARHWRHYNTLLPAVEIVRKIDGYSLSSNYKK